MISPFQRSLVKPTLILVDFTLFELAKFSSGDGVSAKIYIYALYMCPLSVLLLGIAHKIHTVNQASHAVNEFNQYMYM